MTFNSATTSHIINQVCWISLNYLFLSRTFFSCMTIWTKVVYSVCKREGAFVMSLGFVPCTGYASAWHVVLTQLFLSILCHIIYDWVSRQLRGNSLQYINPWLWFVAAEHVTQTHVVFIVEDTFTLLNYQAVLHLSLTLRLMSLVLCDLATFCRDQSQALWVITDV